MCTNKAKEIKFNFSLMQVLYANGRVVEIFSLQMGGANEIKVNKPAWATC